MTVLLVLCLFLPVFSVLRTAQFNVLDRMLSWFTVAWRLLSRGLVTLGCFQSESDGRTSRVRKALSSLMFEAVTQYTFTVID